MHLRRELRLRDLVFFNICAIASARWIAAAAHAGPGSLVLWAAAAIFFFVPSAIVVARLAEKFPEQGGMYIWTKHTLGDCHAFLCAWFYFFSNVLYLPSLLLAGVSMISFAFGDTGARLAEDKAFLVPVTLAVLWSLFLLNFFGLRAAKWVSAFGGVSVLAIVLLAALYAAAALRHVPSATAFHLTPSARFDTVNFWSQIAFAFVGLELAPVLCGEMRNPRRDVRRAAWIAGSICTALYVIGTTALLILLPPDRISPVTGIMQAAVAAAGPMHAPWTAALMVIPIAIGLAGQLDTWIAGNTRLPYAIGLDRYLPRAFERVHPRWSTPHIALLAQAIAATAFLLLSELGETARAAYQILVDTTVIATFIPFVYIFAAGFRFASRIAAISGLAVTALAIVCSAVPFAEAGSVLRFELKVVGGCVLFAAAGYALFRHYRARRLAEEIPRAGDGSDALRSRV